MKAQKKKTLSAFTPHHPHPLALSPLPNPPPLPNSHPPRPSLSFGKQDSARRQCCGISCFIPINCLDRVLPCFARCESFHGARRTPQMCRGCGFSPTAVGAAVAAAVWLRNAEVRRASKSAGLLSQALSHHHGGARNAPLHHGARLAWPHRHQGCGSDLIGPNRLNMTRQRPWSHCGTAKTL